MKGPLPSCRTVSVLAVIVREEERMEAAFALEGPAVEVRERLAGFVEEVAERLRLRRQRENALLYVRGLAWTPVARRHLPG